MRYLFFFICLPCCAIAQQNNLRITVTPCQPSQYIEIKNQNYQGGAYKIFRRSEKSRFILIDTTMYQGTFRDTSALVRTGQPFYYQVQLNGMLSNSVGGYVCVNAGDTPPLSAQDETNALQPLIFKWNGGARTYYQIQAARDSTDFSIKTGFKKPLLDSINSSSWNQFEWNYRAKIGDTLYWTVRERYYSNNSYFINPVMKIIVGYRGIPSHNTSDRSSNLEDPDLEDPDFEYRKYTKPKWESNTTTTEPSNVPKSNEKRSEPSQEPILILRILKQSQNSISVSIENRSRNMLRSVKLNCYESDKPNEPSLLSYVKTEKVDDIAGYQTKTVTIELQPSQTYLTIIPTMGGVSYTNSKVTHKKK